MISLKEGAEQAAAIASQVLGMTPVELLQIINELIAALQDDITSLIAALSSDPTALAQSLMGELKSLIDELLGEFELEELAGIFSPAAVELIKNWSELDKDPYKKCQLMFTMMKDITLLILSFFTGGSTLVNAGKSLDKIKQILSRLFNILRSSRFAAMRLPRLCKFFKNERIRAILIQLGIGCFGSGTMVLTFVLVANADTGALEWKEQSVPIESIRAGDRVATGEAIDQISQTSRVNSRQWRRVGLMLYGADHSGNEKTVQCEVLVPDSWLKTNVAQADRFCVQPSSSFPLDGDELGIRGQVWATLLYNEVCPDIQLGPGQLVMATWHHVTQEPMLALTIRGPPRFDAISGSTETIYCTPEHRLFSARRQAWVSASELEIDEPLASNLRQPGSLVRVIAIQHLPPASTVVHNLTVEHAHQFLVAKANVLAHNMSKSKKNADCDAPKGGRYGDVRSGNIGGQVHHTPASAISPYTHHTGPSVWMETADHVQTGSWGRSKAAQAYRQKQADLIAQGKIRESVQMDIDDIRSKFGNKYNDHIQEMLDAFGDEF